MTTVGPKAPPSIKCEVPPSTEAVIDCRVLQGSTRLLPVGVTKFSCVTVARGGHFIMHGFLVVALSSDAGGVLHGVKSVEQRGCLFGDVFKTRQVYQNVYFEDRGYYIRNKFDDRGPCCNFRGSMTSLLRVQG